MFSVDLVEMSEYDYDSTSCSETESDHESVSGSENSFTSIAAALESMREKLELFGEGIDGLHAGVKHMEQPVTGIAIAPFAQPRYLETAPFRKGRFALKEEAKRLLGFEKDNAKFSTICAALRTYCFRNKLVDAAGIIHVNKELQSAFNLQESETTFLGILLHLDKLVN